MTRLRLVPVALAVLVAAVSACGGDRIDGSPRVQRCRQRCEAAKECDGASLSTKTTDCYVACDDVDAINQSTNCYDRFDELYDCIDRKGVCAADEACDSYRATYEDCISDNCSSNPDRDECAL